MVQGSGAAGASKKEKDSSKGFQLFHIMMIALISLIVGAFISK